MISDKFKDWMRSLTPGAKQAIATNAGTSVAMLYQLSTGHRLASSELAARIENAAPDAISRADINSTCRECPYFKQCGK